MKRVTTSARSLAAGTTIAVATFTAVFFLTSVLYGLSSLLDIIRSPYSPGYTLGGIAESLFTGLFLLLFIATVACGVAAIAGLVIGLPLTVGIARVLRNSESVRAQGWGVALAGALTGTIVTCLYGAIAGFSLVTLGAGILFAVATAFSAWVGWLVLARAAPARETTDPSGTQPL